MGDTELFLKREWLNPKATIGELFIDTSPNRQCYTLEDIHQPVKVPGQTCIPAGRYQIALYHSDIFGRVMPHLLNVPGFDGILIHPGNDDLDTKGCILVGRIPVNDDFIGESRVAFTDLFQTLTYANSHGKIWITITEEPASTPQVFV